MSSDPGIGASGNAPWYRVVALPDAPYGGTAERDYASALPALLDAAKRSRAFVVGWFSRGGGAPLELFTNAGPLPPPPARPLRDSVPSPASAVRAAEDAGEPGARSGTSGHPAAAEHPYGPPSDFLDRLAAQVGAAEAGAAGQQCELLFPWGARGAPFTEGLMADLGRLIWAPCPGRQAPVLAADGAGRDQGWSGGGGGHQASAAGSWLSSGAGLGGGLAGGGPRLFESALTTLMARPFGWLVVAEPTDQIDAETAELRSQLNVLRRFDEERSRF